MTKSDFSGFWVEEESKGDTIVNIGNVWRKGLLLGILLLVLIGSAQAEDFTVRVEKDIIGFDENQITVETDQTGLLTLTLSDNYGTYRTITREAKRGATTFMWDGLGENEERLPSGSYTLHALLVTARGNQEMQINVTVGKAKQALLFALRSSDTLYLDTDDWFCEAKPVRTGAVVMDIYAADDLNTKLDTLKKTFGSTTKVSWNGRVKGKKVAEGDYLLRFYAESNPAYVRDVRVTVKKGERPVIPVAETGSIMPTWDMDDAAMWDMMMKPSVVVDIAAVSHQKVYDKPSTNGKALGTLHGQSQGVEVLKVEGGWAYIGAWQHESGGYIEGWVPMKRLKTVTPNSDFGLVVDKQTQRMKVFYRGKCITTLTISTGLAGKNRLIRETAAGAFITSRTAAITTSTPSATTAATSSTSWATRRSARRRTSPTKNRCWGRRARTGASAFRARWMQPGSTSTTYGHTCPTARVCSSSMTRKIVRCKPPPSAIRCRRM